MGQRAHPGKDNELAQQTVGVLAGTTLPWAVRVTEVHRHAPEFDSSRLSSTVGVNKINEFQA